MNSAEPPAATAPAPLPAPSGWSRAGAAVERWYRDPARRTMWLISALSAIWFTALLAFWSRGALLYRIDFPGVYTIGGFLLFPSADYIIPSIASAVSFGNLSFAQYLSLSVDVFLCTLGAQLLVRELFRNTFSAPQLVGVQALAATFYLVNPYNITWGYYALTLNLFLHNAAFFLVMTLVVRMARDLLARQPFAWKNAVWLGVGVGLSAPTSFPDLARTLLFELVAFVLLGILALAVALSRRAGQPVSGIAVKRFFAVSLPIAGVLLAYPVWLFVSNWLIHPDAIGVVAARGAIVPPNSYNSLPNVVRLLGRKDFDLFPYYPLYLHNWAIILGTWLWPVFAIALPLLVTWKFAPALRDRKWVWISELLIVPCVVWGTGLDPPFGGFNAWVIGLLPFGRLFMPAFFPVQLIMVKLYTVLVAFSIGACFLAIRGFWWRKGEPNVVAPAPADPPVDSPAVKRRQWRDSRRSARRAGIIAASAFSIFAVAFLLFGEVPIFDGSIMYTQNGTKGGFFVPPAYFLTRNYLQHQSGNALLLPAVGLYIHTNWNYVGVTGFYSEFYYPSKILEPAYYGPYAYLLNSTKDSYVNATRPLAPGNDAIQLTGSFAKPFQQYNATPPNLVSSKISPALNLTSYAWLEVTIPTKDPALFLNYLANQEVTIELESSSSVHGYYDFGRGGETCLLSSNATSVDVGLLVSAPSTESYDASNVSKILLKFPSPGFIPTLQLGAPTFAATSDSSLVPGWLGLIRSNYHLRFILVDLSIHGGRTEPNAYATAVVSTLAAQGLAYEVVITPYLELWELT